MATDWFVEECARCARDAHKLLMRAGMSGLDPALFLYCKRGGLLFVSDEDPPLAGWELGCAERLPINLTVDQTIRWTTDRARRLPCLPLEG